MRKIKKIKSFVNNHYYALCLFAFLLTYLAIVPGDCKPWIVDDMAYSFYVVDFSVGFCSRIIQGAILNLFTNTFNTTTVSIYLTVILISTFAIICYLAEKFILNTEPQYRKCAIIIILFFLVGPCTLSIHIKTIGIIDTFWLFSTVLALLCLQKKQLYFLIAFLCVFMVFVYYPAILCYIPFLAIILLYKISVSNEKKEKKHLTAIFLISVIFSVAFTLYFSVFERSNLNYTMNEFHEFLASRGVKPGFFMYYDYSFYRYTSAFEDNNNVILPSFESGDSVLSGISVIFQQIATTLLLTEFSHITVIVLLLILPILIYIYRFFIIEIRNTENNKLKIFSLICMMLLFPATILLGICFSTDIIRWISNAFTPLFLSFIFVLYKEGKRAWERVYNDICSINTVFLIPYFLLYALTLFFPDRG